MSNAWITALKKFNEGKGTWCLPKKGTKEYDEVRALMEPTVPKKKPSVKAMAEAYNVPLPLLKKAAKDYYARVSNAGSEADRKRLIDNMPDQLRKGFAAYEKKINK
jgi:hypothetical protein